MLRRKFVTVGAATLAGLLSAPLAQAAPNDIFTYEVGTGTNGPVSANPKVIAKAGDTLTFRIFLRDLLAQGATTAKPLLDPLNENGLFGAGVRILRVGPGPASAVTLTGVAPNAVDFPLIANPPPDVPGPGDQSFIEGVSLAATSGTQMGNTGGGVSPNTPAGDVFLGTVTVTVPANPQPSTLFTVSGVPGNTLSFNSGNDLDLASNTNPPYVGTAAQNPIASFTVVTPEPTALSLLALVGGGLMARRRKAAGASKL